MSRMIWGKVRNDRYRQERLKFGQSEEVKNEEPGVMGRGYMPLYTADGQLHGPTGGGQRDTKANRQPMATKQGIPAYNPCYTRQSIDDVRKRNSNDKPEQTGIDVDLVVKALLGEEHKADRKLFSGVCFHINTGVVCDGISSYHLEHLINYHGGTVNYFPGKNVTHELCSNLSAAKEVAASKRLGRVSGGAVLVTPDWVLDSLRSGKRMVEANYGLSTAEAQPAKRLKLECTKLEKIKTERKKVEVIELD